MTLGRAAITLYYSGVGERAADILQRHAPLMLPVIRSGLDALVAWYSLQHENRAGSRR